MSLCEGCDEISFVIHFFDRGDRLSIFHVIVNGWGKKQDTILHSGRGYISSLLIPYTVESICIAGETVISVSQGSNFDTVSSEEIST